jgi:Asp-tRNA(Asn)/Glu-tRNA(Gln) amidotransferase C subunit
MNTIEDVGIGVDARADRIAETAAMLDAGTQRLLTDVRRFDVEEMWGAQGCLSCAHWLNWRCGIALGAAREKVRVARALGSLPLIDDALRLGQVSYSKVRAMTRVATPENERQLLDLATASTASQLEKICRLFDQMVRPDRQPEPERWMRVAHTDDGMVRIDVKVRREEAARLLEACRASAETRVDGLVAIAEATLRGSSTERPPVEVTVQVDAATLAGQHADTGLSAATSRRLLCDAGIVAMTVDSAGTPLNVGRKTRVISTALRRALLARDKGCRFPGCTNHRFVDAHHVKHWADGGETSLENTLLAGSRHHAMLHEGGFSIDPDGRFIDPNGKPIPDAGVPPQAVPPPSISRLPSTWMGERLNLAWIDASSRRGGGAGAGEAPVR